MLRVRIKPDDQRASVVKAKGNAFGSLREAGGANLDFPTAAVQVWGAEAQNVTVNAVAVAISSALVLQEVEAEWAVTNRKAIEEAIGRTIGVEEKDAVRLVSIQQGIAEKSDTSDLGTLTLNRRLQEFGAAGSRSLEGSFGLGATPPFYPGLYDASSTDEVLLRASSSAAAHFEEHRELAQTYTSSMKVEFEVTSREEKRGLAFESKLAFLNKKSPTICDTFLANVDASLENTSDKSRQFAGFQFASPRVKKISPSLRARTVSELGERPATARGTVNPKARASYSGAGEEPKVDAQSTGGTTETAISGAVIGLLIGGLMGLLVCVSALKDQRVRAGVKRARGRARQRLLDLLNAEEKEEYSTLVGTTDKVGEQNLSFCSTRDKGA